MMNELLHNCMTLLMVFLFLTALVYPFTKPARNRILNGTPFYPAEYHMPGDINHDFMITDMDVYYLQSIYIMQYNHDETLEAYLNALGMTETQLLERTDFNQDGILNNEDAAVLLMYLSGGNANAITFEEYCHELMETG